MANKAVVLFAYQFKGDGSSITQTITLATGPVAFYPNGGSPGAPSLLSGVTSGVPSGVEDVSCPGLTVNSVAYLLGVLTVTFSAAPSSNTFYTVSGTLLF